jgi:hypothetical protein
MSLESNVLVKNNMCLSCPNPLVNMDIISSQNKHFDQVGPFKRSWFIAVQSSDPPLGNPPLGEPLGGFPPSCGCELSFIGYWNETPLP